MKAKKSLYHKNLDKPRARVLWNTGERVHLPKKGKGSYKRKNYK
jgi:stalled ribosome alternative rescue factor ArfA